MDIFNRYFGESEMSLGQNFPQNIVFTDGKAVVDDEAGAQLCLEYPHKINNHPWRVEDMLNNKDGSDFATEKLDAEAPVPADPTVFSVPTPAPPSLSIVDPDDDDEDPSN